MSVKIIIAPVPQFEWKNPISAKLSPTMSILPLLPEVRRKMLDAAKRQNASEDVMRVTLESERVILAGVPMNGSEPATLMTAALYSFVVNLALKRFVDFLRLEDDVPDCFDVSCWYTADGRPDVQSTPFSLIQPGWRCPTHYARDEHPVFGIVYSLQDPWKSRTTDLLRIDELDGLFTTFIKDPNVDKEAYALLQGRVQKFLRARASEQFGVPPDEVKFEWAEEEVVPGFKQIMIMVPEEDMKDDTQTLVTGDTMSLYSDWFSEARAYIYSKRLRDAERARYINPSQSRFLRAYQAFTNSFRMDDPFRYVARATCLEALLGVDKAEVTFQVASRAAWLLKPSDSEARLAVYKNVKRYYDLRSSIVHGDKYKLTDLDDFGAKLLEVDRELLRKIISDDNLHKLFFEAGKTPCDEFLRHLSIGYASDQQAAPPAE